MKRGFSMLFTIIFLLAMSFMGYMIAVFSLSTVSHTTTSYLDTQADLYLENAKEFAIMAIQAHDFNKSDINEINLTYPGFRANIKFHYFRTDCNNSSCSTIETKDTNMSFLVYVTLTSTNPNFHIRKVEVTLQNP